jgi:2-polyprenyl-6-methoxyphenol hydroxylase-like FAD-dependent oxidoreductase
VTTFDECAVNSDGFDADVLVVGAGPTGLTLAAALLARGVRAAVVDRLAEGANTSRAAVIHARTLEVLEPLGVVAPLLARGLKIERFTIRDRDHVLMPIGFSQLPTPHPYTLMVSQAETESVLHARLEALGGRVLRPRTLTALTQDAAGATATLDDGTTLRARFVVGADGMHRRVRECAQIPFSGGRYAESFVLADTRLEGGVPHDEVVLYFSPAGMVVVAPLPGGRHRIVATVDAAPEQPSVAFVQALLDARGPARARARVLEVVWGSRFRVHHRVAERYRSGRIVLAGDAAHVHSPAGGQGMNAGILDAMSLAGALVNALAGDLATLDAYAAERRPIARQIVGFADRLTRLATVPRLLRPLRNGVIGALARLPGVRRRLAWQLSGLSYRHAQHRADTLPDACTTPKRRPATCAAAAPTGPSTRSPRASTRTSASRPRAGTGASTSR